MTILRALLQVGSSLTLLAVIAGYLGGVAFVLDVVGFFRLHFLIVSIFLALAAVVVRDGRAFVGAGAAAILALAGLSPLWESAPDGKPTSYSFTVMTANLFNKNRSIAELRAVLNGADADILITNETTVAMLEGPDALSLRYPYRVTLKTGGRVLRTVLWSRFPISETSLLLDDKTEPNAAIARIRLPGGTEVTVIGVHLDHAFRGSQERQIAAFAPTTEALSRPLIIAGDFNSATWSRGMDLVESITQTKLIPGYRLTWRGPYPTPFGAIPEPLGHGIDHILISDGLIVREVRVVELPGSDHAGVFATLELEGN